MTPRIVKVLLRIVGTLAGLVGGGMLCVSTVVFYRSYNVLSAEMREFWMIGLAAFTLALAVYFLFVAYLVWFRFSPRAVRHVCGVLGFYVLMSTTKLFPSVHNSDTSWMAFVFLGLLVGVYFAYRWASTRLSRYLFPEAGSGVQP